VNSKLSYLLLTALVVSALFGTAPQAQAQPFIAVSPDNGGPYIDVSPNGTTTVQVIATPTDYPNGSYYILNDYFVNLTTLPSGCTFYPPGNFYTGAIRALQCVNTPVGVTAFTVEACDNSQSPRLCTTRYLYISSHY